mmetsp:Transcript_13110/g.38569  ORF Transcript_13110/g.38569 Transcript_13110/m.38569 type:complete len:232 (-) Transcript_13110:390-1085(-)
MTMKTAVAAAVLCAGLSSPAGAFSPAVASTRTSGPFRLSPSVRPSNHLDVAGTPTATSLAVVPPAGVDVISPSYDLAVGSIALAAAFGLPQSPLKSRISAFLGGIPLLLFGLFLTYQTTTLRFTFDDTNFSLVKSDLSSTGENVVVGGENVWAYDKFVNYDFFPSRDFPVLVYFKETQTPEKYWNDGPGASANSDEALSKGAVPGQVHFFPAIGNVEKMAGEFDSRGCAKL